MVGAIERELQKNEYFTMIRSVSKNADIISLLKNWNVDGIIILYPAAGEYMARLMDSATCPIATFDCELEHPNLINITSNDEKGLYLSTKYMINHGHSAIAFVADYKNNHVLTSVSMAINGRWRRTILLLTRIMFMSTLLPMRAVSRPAVRSHPTALQLPLR